MPAPLVTPARSPRGQATAVDLLVRRSLALAAGTALLAVGAQLPASAAPGDTSSGTTTANVEVTSSISLTGLTPSFTLSGLPGDTVTGDTKVSYDVTTNNAAGYTVTVQAAADQLAPNGTTNPDRIPIGNLKVRADRTGAFTAISDTSAVTLRTKATRSAAAGDAYADDYQVVIPFVASDTYSATLSYVATAS